ncbi:hypothetical protein [Lysobacter auxotrophicus]|uniref:Uncharacterized protein n=1 Tax=Lysobacter auxotrophicus TaxID=2992573 RepID=A0ABN6UH70_9GAMM|nr:hypothetical protein [Lysobacter auxotrophicus]BDU15624.1 hypothetical protein LA521A_08250 [Lysobacter auxotrophicus]
MTRIAPARLLALAALLPLATTAMAQQKIEQQMSYEQFKASGLEKLSPTELANLNAWLAGKLEVETAKAVETVRQESGDDRRGLAAERESRDPVAASIAGAFTGFGKGRQFSLDNGQVWRQIDEVALSAKLDNPKVRLTPSLIGSAWYLAVEGYNTRAKVERVK